MIPCISAEEEESRSDVDNTGEYSVFSNSSMKLFQNILHLVDTSFLHKKSVKH